MNISHEEKLLYILDFDRSIHRSKTGLFKSYIHEHEQAKGLKEITGLFNFMNDGIFRTFISFKLALCSVLCKSLQVI